MSFKPESIISQQISQFSHLQKLPTILRFEKKIGGIKQQKPGLPTIVGIRSFQGHGGIVCSDLPGMKTGTGFTITSSFVPRKQSKTLWKTGWMKNPIILSHTLVMLISWAIPISIQRIRDMNTAKTKTWRGCEKPEKSFMYFSNKFWASGQLRGFLGVFWATFLGGFSLPKLEAMETDLVDETCSDSLKKHSWKDGSRWVCVSKDAFQIKGFWNDWTVMIWFIIQVKQPFMDVSGSRCVFLFHEIVVSLSPHQTSFGKFLTALSPLRSGVNEMYKNVVF